MSKISKVPVSAAALQQRLNRHLASEGQALRKARGRHDREQLGDFYLVDLSGKRPPRPVSDPVLFARQLGVLAAFEEVAR